MVDELIALLLACALASPPDGVPMTELTHQTVTLTVPHWPNNRGNYAELRAEPLYDDVIDARMIPALQSAGAPEQRISRMMEASNAARASIAAAHKVPGDGLAAVEIDLKVAFVHALAEAVMASEASAAAKRDALERLRGLGTAPHPVGLPPDDPMHPWTLGARMAAEAEVEVQLEALP